jgi:general stress protein YciG
MNDNDNMNDTNGAEGVKTHIDSTKTGGKKPRGFAAMDPALVSEIARKGGVAAHAAGTAHRYTSEEARLAGHKGGVACHAKRKASSGTDSL